MSPSSPSASSLIPAVKYRALGMTLSEPAGNRSPHALDGDRAAVVSQLAEELAGRGVEGVDPAVAEVSDQDVAAEGSEGGRRQRHRPRGVEPILAGEPLQQVAVRREDVDKAIAWPGVVIVFGRVLFGEGDVQVAADVVDAERGEASRDGGVGEAV